MSNIKSLYPGSKLFKFNDEELNIIRVTSVDVETGKVKYFDSNGKKESSQYDKIINEYTLLKPDGVVMFTIVSIGDGISDVLVALTNTRNINDNLPYAICRQSVYWGMGICSVNGNGVCN